MQALVYEFPNSHIEDDAEMATNESLAKEVSALSQRLVATETELGLWRKFIGWVSGIALVAGISALGWSVHIGNKVTAIEQQLSDGGNTKLVAELEKPQSPAQLQANLSTVVAQIQTASVRGEKPDEKKVESLSSALSRVVASNPNLPEAWKAAAQLASFRSPKLPTSNKDCLLSPPQDLVAVTVDGKSIPDQIRYHDCVFDLGNTTGFAATSAGKALNEERGASLQSNPLIFILSNVRIVYHGGPIIPFTLLKCVNCSFDLDFNESLPQPARELTQTLLAATDYHSISVDSRRGL